MHRIPARPLFALATLAAFLAFSPAHAQQAKAAAPDASTWALGVAGGVEQIPYAGYGNKTRALPWLMYNGRYFRFAGTGLDLKLGAVGPVAFDLRLKYSDEGYKSGDAPILNGMQDRKGGFWAGAHAMWRNPYADLSLEWLTDASGKSSGQTFKLLAEHRFKSGSFTFVPYLGANWMSSNYVDYYFGVRQSEVTAQRAFYQGGSTTNLLGGLRTDYSLTQNQSLFLDVRMTHFGSGITDSPLVNRSNAGAVRAGYLYRF